MANEPASYYTEVSNEFDPLAPDQIPVTEGKSLPMLAVHEVATRIKYFRKPKSMVKGEIFPCLMTKYADFLAIPLTSVYNAITLTKIWPACWKLECHCHTQDHQPD